MLRIIENIRKEIKNTPLIRDKYMVDRVENGEGGGGGQGQQHFMGGGWLN